MIRQRSSFLDMMLPLVLLKRILILLPVVIVVAAVPFESCQTFHLDFDGPSTIVPGQYVTTEFQEEYHVRIQVLDTIGSYAPNGGAARIFDSSSSSPHDTADDKDDGYLNTYDIASPNENCPIPGPGKGGGGGPEMSSHNCFQQKNVLIIQSKDAEMVMDTNTNNTILQPLDNPWGGTIIFTFDKPTTVYNVSIMEGGSHINAVLSNRQPYVRTVHNNGAVQEFTTTATTNRINAVQTISIHGKGVIQLEIDFPGPGAVLGMNYLVCDGMQLKQPPKDPTGLAPTPIVVRLLNSTNQKIVIRDIQDRQVVDGTMVGNQLALRVHIPETKVTKVLVAWTDENNQHNSVNVKHVMYTPTFYELYGNSDQTSNEFIPLPYLSTVGEKVMSIIGFDSMGHVVHSKILRFTIIETNMKFFMFDTIQGIDLFEIQNEQQIHNPVVTNLMMIPSAQLSIRMELMNPTISDSCNKIEFSWYDTNGTMVQYTDTTGEEPYLLNGKWINGIQFVPVPALSTPGYKRITVTASGNNTTKIMKQVIEFTILEDIPMSTPSPSYTPTTTPSATPTIVQDVKSDVPSSSSPSMIKPMTLSSPFLRSVGTLLPTSVIIDSMTTKPTKVSIPKSDNPTIIQKPVLPTMLPSNNIVSNSPTLVPSDMATTFPMSLIVDQPVSITSSFPSSTSTTTPNPVQVVTECKKYDLDFKNDMKPGQYITDEYEKKYQVRFFAIQAPRLKLPFGYTPNGAVRIMDTSNPSKNDTMLGSPNQNCTTGNGGSSSSGGPGIGYGGEPTSSYANCSPLGNVLIIQSTEEEEIETYIQGGDITITFTQPVFFNKIGLFGTDDGTSQTQVPELYVLDADYNERVYYTVPLGPNGVNQYKIDVERVIQLRVRLYGKGAISELKYQICPPTKQKSVTSYTFTQPPQQ